MMAPGKLQKLATAIFVVLTTTVLLLTIFGIWLVEPEPVVVPAVQLPELPAEEQSMRSIGYDGDDPVFTRPLFWLDRRPPAMEEPPPVEVSATHSTIDEIELLGVLIAWDDRTALIKSGGTVQRLKTGDSVAGWDIESISDGEVTFTAGNERAAVRVVKPVSPGIHLESP